MKKTVSLLLILVLTLSLCACGNDSGSLLSGNAKFGENSASLKSFYGFWKYEDAERYIMINENNTWEYRGADLYVLSEGTYSLKDDTLVLKAEDNSTAFKLKLDGSKWLIDEDGKNLARYEGADPADTDENFRCFLGMWKYDEFDLLIGINADGTWAMYDLDADAEAHGFCHMENGELVMEDENGQILSRMTLGADDRIYDGMGDPLSPYVDDTPAIKEDNTPWFVDNDLLVNYKYGDPNKSVIGAVSVRGQDSQSYTRIPATWYIEQNSYQSTGDGNCIVTLTATALTDGTTMPAFVSKEGYTLTWSWNLCDYYSGVILTEDEEDTFYSYNYESNGETVHVEFSYNCDWTRYDDLSYLFTLTLTVRMPEHYDGLVLVCYNAPESEEIRQEHDLIYEGQTVLPVDQLPGWREMLTGLICRINE
ncbi:MAG: hypothetical protein J5789_07695 [Oscillospiraceae bacterium]|nr:hypothetical protein [Oscillospiraceae bacterium]